MNENDLKFNIVNGRAPLNTRLSAHYKLGFAYYTIRDRLPVILTQVIDELSRDKSEITDERSELKDVIGRLSKLKYELQTDKPMTTLESKAADSKEWNKFLFTLGKNNSYFSAPWLYAECYMYRRIKSIFMTSKELRDYDYFASKKQKALLSCLPAQHSVVAHLNAFYAQEAKDDASVRDFFGKMVQVNLWSNRCDLSISAGMSVEQDSNPFKVLDAWHPCILVNQISELWDCLNTGTPVVVDIVNDNSGYELFTDLCLADFLLETKIASRVRFHVKAYPWFISDVTPSDFRWTLETLTKQDGNLGAIGTKWTNWLSSGQFELIEPTSYFWTLPYEHCRMASVRPDLYKQIGEAQLVIFKGDLNYRKLLSDINWDPTTSFETALQGFHPTNLCALRTVKADPICGLAPGKAEELTAKDPLWMETGEYGLIQFSNKTVSVKTI